MPYYISDVKPLSDRKFRLRYRKNKDLAISIYDTFEWLLVRAGCLLFSDGKDTAFFNGSADVKNGDCSVRSEKRHLFEKMSVGIIVHSFTANEIKGILYTLPDGYIIYTPEMQDEFTFHYCMDELKSFGGGLLAYVKRKGDPMMRYTTRVQCRADDSAVLHDSMETVYGELIKIMRLNTDGIINGYDAEFLHDFRVSVRRTRSAMSMLKGVYEDAEEARYKNFFRTLGGYTGKARDMDVYLEELECYDELLPDEMKDALAPLREHFKGERDESYEKLKNFLTSEEYNIDLAGWEKLISSRAHIGRKGFVNTKKAANKALAKIFGLAESITDGVGADTPDEQIHSVRIAFKKLRYCIEFFALFIKEEKTADVLTRLRALQDSLGRYNDLSVQCAHMQGRLNEEKDAKVLTACGYILAVLTLKKAQERETAVELIRIFRKGRKRVKKSLGI
ncbi:MAG: CHAD domain-containing protein [Deferribacterales bacterium]